MSPLEYFYQATTGPRALWNVVMVKKGISMSIVVPIEISRTRPYSSKIKNIGPGDEATDSGPWHKK